MNDETRMQIAQLIKDKLELRDHVRKTIHSCDKTIEKLDITDIMVTFRILLAASGIGVAALLSFFLLNAISHVTITVSIIIGVSAGVAEALFMIRGYRVLSETREEMCKMLEDLNNDIERYQQLIGVCEKTDR